MSAVEEIVVNEENKWRLDAPAVSGWKKSVRPGPNKYFMISCDTHLMPPVTLFRDRLDRKWHDMLPKIEKREDGERYLVMPGAPPACSNAFRSCAPRRSRRTRAGCRG